MSGPNSTGLIQSSPDFLTSSRAQILRPLVYFNGFFSGQPLLSRGGRTFSDGSGQLLNLGIEKLDEIRKLKSDAAGLVVAMNIQHAHQVALGIEEQGRKLPGCDYNLWDEPSCKAALRKRFEAFADLGTTRWLLIEFQRS
ncbi:hypothetical protein [Pseudomonas rossensis]|uniref:hypothetical protein n=1 Tax=Pseudomonas rossensis TaxID=2305471 RepID=UPI0032617B3E